MSSILPVFPCFSVQKPEFPMMFQQQCYVLVVEVNSRLEAAVSRACEQELGSSKLDL